MFSNFVHFKFNLAIHPLEFENDCTESILGKLTLYYVIYPHSFRLFFKDFIFMFAIIHQSHWGGDMYAFVQFSK